MIFNKCFLFVAMTVTTATALTHGHVARGNSHYEVARSVIDGLAKKDLVVPVPAIRRRASNSQRCKPRPKKADSSSSSSSTTSSTADHKATPAKADVAPPKTSETHTHTSSKAADTPKPSKSTSGSDGGGGGGISFNGGQATYFTQNGVAGACGTVHSDGSLVCALFTSVYSGGSHCGKTVLLTNMNNGQTGTCIVADECPTCNGPNCIDLSEGAFNAIGATKDQGEVPIKYTII